MRQPAPPPLLFPSFLPSFFLPAFPLTKANACPPACLPPTHPHTRIHRDLADVVIQVLPTQLVPDNEGKILRVRMIQKEGRKNYDPTYLFDEGSTVSWIPCGRKLTCSFPGIKFAYGPDSVNGEEVSVLEMDGQFDKLEELIYVESHLSNTSAKFYGEITQTMLKNASFPGSNNGTGLFQVS